MKVIALFLIFCQPIFASVNKNTDFEINLLRDRVNFYAQRIQSILQKENTLFLNEHFIWTSAKKLLKRVEHLLSNEDSMTATDYDEILEEMKSALKNLTVSENEATELAATIRNLESLIFQWGRNHELAGIITEINQWLVDKKRRLALLKGESSSHAITAAEVRERIAIILKKTLPIIKKLDENEYLKDREKDEESKEDLIEAKKQAESLYNRLMMGFPGSYFRPSNVREEL